MHSLESARISFFVNTQILDATPRNFTFQSRFQKRVGSAARPSMEGLPEPRPSRDNHVKVLFVAANVIASESPCIA